MYKKLFLVLIVALLSFGSISCGENIDNKSEEKDKIGEIAPKKAPTENEQVIDDDIYQSFNKTYSVDEGGIKGSLYIGLPTENFKQDEKGKDYLEITLPMTLTNSTGGEIAPTEIIKKIKISEEFIPYKDKLELRYEKTGKIIEGNSKDSSEDYFIKILNTNNGKSDGILKMENEESRQSYYKFKVYPKDIGLENNEDFKDVKIDSFQFVVPDRDGSGYNIVK